MGRIFLKGLWNRRNNYFIVVLCGVFQVSITFAVSALWEYLSLMVNGRLSEYLEAELMAEMFFLTYELLLFLMILVFLSYIRKRAGDYAALESLGMKKKHKYMFIACEYGGVFVLSLGIGVLLGVLFSGLLKYGLLRVFPDLAADLYYGISPWCMVVIAQIVTYIIIFIFFDETIACLGIDALMTLGRRGGKSYKRHFLVQCAGPVLIAVSFVNMGLYWGKGAESVPSTAALAGLFLLMAAMSGNYFDRLERNQRVYYKKILWLDHWYQQFFYNINMSFVMAAFLFVIGFSFFVSLLDNVPVTAPEDFPYDLVWMANKDDQEFLDQLEVDYGVEIETQPCIRVSTGDFAEQTAISASAYEAWTGRHLDLKDREIFVVYQRNRADRNSLGIDYNAETPHIYIGCARNDLWLYVQDNIIPGRQFEDSYKIIGCENRILTGVLSASNQENIVVFSDEYYAGVCEKAEGSDLAVMMQIPDHYQTAAKRIYSYAKQHSQTNFFSSEGGNLIYEKRILMKADQRSRMFHAVINGINIMILLVCTLFILGLKAENDFDQLGQKNKLYVQFGISDKKQAGGIKREIAVPGMISVLFGVGLSLLFMMQKIYLKEMESFWNIRYILGVLALSGGIIVIFVLVIIFLAGRQIRRIRKGNEDE